jgi:hypothetical protein
MKISRASVIAELKALGIEPDSEGRISVTALRKALADDGGFAVNRRGRKLYDEKGPEPGEKDVQRMRDMKKKAAGVESKALNLAKQMAHAIQDSDKAMRRAWAAKKVFEGKLAKQIFEIFSDRANELGDGELAA